MSYDKRRRFLLILFLAGLVLLGLFSAVTKATTLVRLHFEELAQQSTAIARLRCLHSRTKWERGEIWTDTQFEVLEVAKGLLPSLVTVRTMGGTSGHLHSHVDEVPTFHLGEELYLFLWTNSGEPYRVLGWSQGAFRISRNTVTGFESVTQDSAGSPVFDPQGHEFRRSGIRNLSVPEFQRTLRQALNQDIR
jgi:hypothetical protein